RKPRLIRGDGDCCTGSCGRTSSDCILGAIGAGAKAPAGEMVRDTGVAPVTPSVSGRCSTTELTALEEVSLRAAKLGGNRSAAQPLFHRTSPKKSRAIPEIAA